MNIFNKNIKIIISVVLIIISVISCKGNDNQETTNLIDSLSKEKEFKETKYSAESDYKLSSPYLKISMEKHQFVLRFIEDRAYLQYFFNTQIKKDWIPIVYNFTYNSSYEDAQTDIHILKNNNEGFLILPSYTEEFLTYSVYRFNENGIKYFNTIKLDFNEKIDKFQIFAKENTETIFYLKTHNNKITNLIFEDLYPIDSSKINEDIRIIQENNKKNINKPYNDKQIIIKKHQDVNGDDIPDDFYILRNEKGLSDFEKTHFSLPVSITLSQKNNPSKIFYKYNIIPPQINNCVSEGFNNLIVNNNYFTIEYQTCFDHNIIVMSYLTFEIKENDILLHKYTEEYFDKSDHDKVTPTKYWTTKDFGTVPFEDVNQGFLINLREKE